MEISFRNNKDDMEAYFDYYLNETEEGKQWAKKVKWNAQFVIFLYFVILLYAFAQTRDFNSIAILVGLFLLLEIILFVVTKFRTKHNPAMRSVRNSTKNWSSREWQIFQRRKTIIADENWLEITSRDVNHRYRWQIIDSIDVKPNYIFIRNGGPTIIPRRDFPTDQSYKDFGNSILEYFEKNKDQPMTMD
jgi:hypothetical protein